MSQAKNTKLMSKLRIDLNRRRKLKNSGGSQGRQDKIRKTLTGLIKHERIELNYNLADESRGYAERLISDAIRYGDCHKETMEMASYWILEKQLVHKLFKVLVPRYQETPVSYTNMVNAPNLFQNRNFNKVVLELRNNIYPPLIPNHQNNRNYIHNVLLDEARKEFRKQKYAQVAENLAPIDLEAPVETLAQLRIDEAEPVISETPKNPAT